VTTPPIGTELIATLSAAIVACDLPAAPAEEVRAALSTAAGGPVERLTGAAAALGLRLRERRGTLEDALADVAPGLPALFVDGDDHPTLVHGASWRGVILDAPADGHGPRPVRWRVARARLGYDASPDRPYWLVEPLYPSSPFAADGASPLRRVTSLVRTERNDVAAILVHAVATGLLALATPLAIQALITWLAFGALVQPIVGLTLVVLVVLAFAAGLRALQRHTVEIVQRRVFVRLMLDVTTRLTRVRAEAFDKASGPELVNRFFDVLTVQKAAAALLVDGASAALQAAIGLLLLALYHPILLVFDVVLVVGMLVVLFPLGRGATRTAIVESKRKYQAAAWMEEVARHPAALQLGGSALAERKAEEIATAYLRDRDAHFRVFFRQYVGMQAIQVAVGAGLLLLCGWLVLEGELSVGQLVAAEFIVAAALTGFAKVVEKLDTWYDLVAAVDKIGALTDLPQHSTRGGLAPGGGPAAVRVEGLSVGPLRGFTAGVAPGDVATWAVPDAARGPFAEVLLGLRAPDDGRCLRDEADLSHQRADAIWRDGALLRRTAILQASIRDNVALARPDIDDVRVFEALAAVGLADRVGNLKDGLETPLASSGAPLSGDDVTRLLAARALAGRPRVVVVDGLFGDCRPDTTRRVAEALGRAATVIVLQSSDAAPARSVA
jgi:putative ABC transport system ATP-binding protein